MPSDGEHQFLPHNAPVNWIPGRGRPGWGGDSAPTFCTILHSPRPPRHIFLLLIPAPLKAHIHISLYENDTLQELLFLSVIPWGEIFAYCHHPGSLWLRPCFSIRWQRSLPAPSSVPISSTTKLLCYPMTLTTAVGDDSDSHWRQPWLRGGAIH